MKNNQLSFDELLKVMAYLKARKEQLHTDRPSYRRVADDATSALGFRVTRYNLRTAAKRAQMAWKAKPEYTIPRYGDKTNQDTKKESTIEELRREIGVLRKEVLSLKNIIFSRLYSLLQDTQKDWPPPEPHCTSWQETK